MAAAMAFPLAGSSDEVAGDALFRLDTLFRCFWEKLQHRLPTYAPQTLPVCLPTKPTLHPRAQ
ncbi:Hypothetical predicted protein, partial [Pelobates cultripes]